MQLICPAQEARCSGSLKVAVKMVVEVWSLPRQRESVAVALRPFLQFLHTGCTRSTFSTQPPNMAGGLVKYRHLSRKSSHRRALLRNLVSSLLEHESISTTWHKAKEAQRLAEKMITHGKTNTEASKRQALKFLFVCIIACVPSYSKLTSHLATTRPPSQTFRTPSRALCESTRRLHTSTSH